MNILLVEDHRLIADAMQLMLRELDPQVQVSACYSSHHALSTLDAGGRFDLIVTDLLMPGIDGLGLLAGLRHRGCRVPVVVISGTDDDRYVRAAIEQGASGFIRKTLPGAEVLAALRDVMAGGQCFPERFRAAHRRAVVGRRDGVPEQDAPLRGDGPTEKQLQVLRLMAAGNSNKQISQIVGITEATVKYHTSQLFRMLEVKNRTSCVRAARARGLLREFEAI